MRGYYFITDASCSAAGNMRDVEQAVAIGVSLIQYRDKSAPTRALFDEALKLKALCRKGHSRLIINDRLDIAMAVDADGVHIGHEDLPYPDARRLLGKEKIIGVSVHSVQEALEVREAGADYLAVGPIFPTSTKADAGPPCGLEMLRAIRNICGTQIPIVAIGGIDLLNVRMVVGAGADMVCAISAVVSKPDMAAEIGKFQREFGL
jgi:thiamine-phosphate pyrophosphorylase